VIKTVLPCASAANVLTTSSPVVSAVNMVIVSKMEVCDQK